MFTETSWTNWIDDHDYRGPRAVPKTVAELRDAVAFAVRNKRRIRAIGSGHSFSNAARPRDIFVDLHELSGEFADVKWIRSNPPGLGVGESLVRVLSGTTIKTLNRVILPKQSAATALINMGAFDAQTLAGAISTATHGTGVRLGSLADLVMSLETITVENVGGNPQVVLYRIEPTQGVTDPASFSAAAGQHGMTLIQDDDVFHSCVVSYGCMGIAFAYILKVQPAYWMKERNTLVNWPSLRDSLRANTINLSDRLGKVPAFAANDRHFSVLLNIAEMQGANATEQAACLVTRRNIAAEEDRPQIWLKQWPPERRVTPLRWIVNDLFQCGPKPHKDHDKLGQRMRNRFFEVEAEQEPFVNNRTATASYIVHRRERDASRDDKDPDPPPDAISIEVAVPATEVTAAIETVIARIQRSDLFFVVPLGIRFVAPSKHFLAPNYDRASAFIEVPFLITRSKPEGGEHLSREETRDRLAKPALREIEEALRDSRLFQGRPHMGKLNHMNRRLVESRYPRFKEWLDAYRRFNGFGTFDNDFTDQMGITGER
jgi:L-gulono-1,4-lactone dehydrogenase